MSTFGHQSKQRQSSQAFVILCPVLWASLTSYFKSLLYKMAFFYSHTFSPMFFSPEKNIGEKVCEYFVL